MKNCMFFSFRIFQRVENVVGSTFFHFKKFVLKNVIARNVNLRMKVVLLWLLIYYQP
jgi:hypothetical protein